MKKRSSGVLMHISSLPSNYGIGTFGKEAYEFVDFLKKAGQTYWQVLPLCLTDSTGSAYQSPSTFAGNVNFIDLPFLEQEGFLKKQDYENLDWGTEETKLNFEKVDKNKINILRKAYANWKAKNKNKLEEFSKQNNWIDSFAIFMTIKKRDQEKIWWDWEDCYKFRKLLNIEMFKKENQEEMNFWIFSQVVFFEQWFKLRKYANDNGIKIIGDLPIYVSGDSADVWENPQNFCLDDTMHPVKVSGCPPDTFSKTGQLWGNPIYKWNEMKKTGYSWWTDRFKSYRKMFDVIRLDHFKGFDSYYSIDASEKTAEHGQWIEGPGIEFFRTIEKNLGKMKVIAENLGYLTDSTRKLLKETEFPGMKILQFAFDSGEQNCYLPHTYEKNSVVYVGTHDNNTAIGWFNEINSQTQKFCKSYLNIPENEQINWALIKAAMASVSNTAIFQMQDFLNLNSSSRMNVPSTVGNLNWKWRALKNDFSDELARKIYNLTKLFDRLN